MIGHAPRNGVRALHDVQPVRRTAAVAPPAVLVDVASGGEAARVFEGVVMPAKEIGPETDDDVGRLEHVVRPVRRAKDQKSPVSIVVVHQWCVGIKVPFGARECLSEARTRKLLAHRKRLLRQYSQAGAVAFAEFAEVLAGEFLELVPR